MTGVAPDVVPPKWLTDAMTVTYDRPRRLLRASPYEENGEVVGLLLELELPRVHDSRADEGTRDVLFRQVIAPVTTCHGAVAAVREFVHRCETHEADEWLRVGGELRWDPHVESESARTTSSPAP